MQLVISDASSQAPPNMSWLHEHDLSFSTKVSILENPLVTGKLEGLVTQGPHLRLNESKTGWGEGKV